MRLLSKPTVEATIGLSCADGSRRILRLAVALLLWSLLIPRMSWAEDVDVGALVGMEPTRQSSTSYEAQFAYATVLREPQKLDINVIHKEKWPLSDSTDLVAIGRLHFDAYDNLEPGKPGQQEVAPISRRIILGDHADVELREFYLKSTIGDGLIQIGKQQVVWGNADGLRVLDVVDPFSFREFFLAEFEDARIPRWKVNYQTPIGSANLQLLWIPDHSYDDFPDAGSSYAITSPRYVPQPVPGVTVIQHPADHPNRFFADSDYGLRLSGRVESWDFSTVYLYRYDPIPAFFRTFETTPLGPAVNVDERYVRSPLIGGTFSNAFGTTVLRGEIGYNFDRYFLTTDLATTEGVLKTNELDYVLGLDFSHFQHTLISMQMFQSRLADNAPTLLRDRVDTTFTFLVNRTFQNEKWVAELLWVHDINDSDGLVRPKLSYKGIDNLTVWVGADVFYGDPIGTFGQFDRQDRVLFGIKWYH